MKTPTREELTTTVTIRLERSVKARLEALARADGRALSNWIAWQLKQLSNQK